MRKDSYTRKLTVIEVSKRGTRAFERAMHAGSTIEVSKEFRQATWLIKGKWFNVNPGVLIKLYALCSQGGGGLRSGKWIKEIKR